MYDSKGSVRNKGCNPVYHIMGDSEMGAHKANGLKNIPPSKYWQARNDETVRFNGHWQRGRGAVFSLQPGP